ncbi:MAG: hypothetical protein R3E42_09285 [Burkholderiaceae bacterium]
MSGQTPLPNTPVDLPLLPLRDVVVFPHMVIPLFIGATEEHQGVGKAATEDERRIMLVAQKAAAGRTVG